MNKLIYKKQLFLCMSTAFLLTACSPGPIPETEPVTMPAESTTEAGNQTSDVQIREELPEWNSQIPVTYNSIIEEYDMGERTYQAQSGKTMPYRVRGVVAAPEEDGVYPLVLITHGSHSNEDENLRFDTGFAYLAEELAGRGYVVVSMDMSAPYTWKYGDGDDMEKSVAVAEEHMQVLKAAGRGEGSFPIDLQNKIDWEQVSLIGHSRGGSNIFDIAMDQQEKGVAVASLLAIAPSMPADLETKEWPDVPTAILVPEYDGDIVSLDGFAIQTILGEKNQSPSMVTMLQRANHNYFNTNLTVNDALLARSEEQLSDQMEGEDQQEFLVSYVLDFLEENLLTKEALTSNWMYGQDVVNRASFLSDERLVADGKLEGNGITTEPVVDSWFFEEDKVIADTITFGQDSYKTKNLYQLLWNQKDGSVRITPTKTDFSRHEMLTLYLLTDPAEERNQQAEYQNLSVTLEDVNGNRATVLVAEGRNSLRKTPGNLEVTPLFDEEITFWSTITPIAATGVPLKLFEGLDLSGIKSITLTMDQTESGAFYLEDVLLQ